MLGYIQALIDCHERRFERATERNDKNSMRYEENFIEELEGLREFYLTQEVEGDNEPIVIAIDGESLGNIDLEELGLN
ncbi:hypothetical protein LI034_03325 [Clostridium perfringens]|uniref:hypothetical protein n=1 Tax=Clostridium perfringens TaxID=1502 RepID=UPI0022479113|nr:hypothetical protein [Clostridium perfringens]MCX0360034.1 hypothetical protein [Clostridium perfringens]